MSETIVKTVPFDARFPNQNQTKNCWQNYVDYHKCIRVKGEDYAPCQQFWRAYSTICPISWIGKWDEQREANVFPALYEKPESHGHH
ncbi:cytochrome c oxidase, subunit VIb [Polychytrium aggregatum]|uniref:cytochrome c oxidase, subunit VIb n=1 Tax=Polychytrium aggregatum TaxID=110093 RepID=UPI0022FE5C99|nr:cytochrome c oxidase, subunit VIb [Polychytrium aggregatum]KAI9202370.1 cytochrome c oxidase, subunit VIb [Polychytrium aggregatum]